MPPTRSTGNVSEPSPVWLVRERGSKARTLGLRGRQSEDASLTGEAKRGRFAY